MPERHVSAHLFRAEISSITRRFPTEDRAFSPAGAYWSAFVARR
jgi:hypothetical protein